MRRSSLSGSAGLVAALMGLGACAASFDASMAPLASPPDTVGPNPRIAPVEKGLIPTVQIAPAKGWPSGSKPRAAQHVAVNAFASGLNHPRWMYVLPNGDVLVAETNAPPKPDDGKGIKGKVMKAVQGRAGAGVPSANRIVLPRDAGGDGQAETKTVFIDKINSPCGMALDHTWKSCRQCRSSRVLNVVLLVCGEPWQLQRDLWITWRGYRLPDVDVAMHGHRHHRGGAECRNRKQQE